jgi:hypothetical protein
MPILLLIFMSLTSFASASDCGAVKSEWLKCSAASDCVVVSNPCGQPKASANKKFADDVLKVNKCLGATISCLAWDEKRDGKLVSNCVEGHCVAIEIPKSPQAECEKGGGRWEGSISGRGRLTGCNLPTKDAGKICSKGEDCESVCLNEGKCYGWKMFKGCGLFKGQKQSFCIE